MAETAKDSAADLPEGVDMGRRAFLGKIVVGGVAAMAAGVALPKGAEAGERDVLAGFAPGVLKNPRVRQDLSAVLASAQPHIVEYWRKMSYQYPDRVIKFTMLDPAIMTLFPTVSIEEQWQLLDLIK